FHVGTVGGVALGPGWAAALDRDTGKVLVFARGEDGTYRFAGSYVIGAGVRGLASVTTETEEGEETDLLVSMRSGDVVRRAGRWEVPERGAGEFGGVAGGGGHRRGWGG